ncbi:uncharacterized protein LOC123523838 [Mercenaria mercenaria]|uniref:uncharacterized protein LOC123523838 n=1 Tax=Mercenaria mercenaria TaxID=6596 RepID=UPI00234F1610|nr:uncharacterized protein LOC123523838 [Mercenaria mercenaria]
MTVYVGETERSLKERTEEHLRDVRQQADKPIMRHFGGHTAEDVKVAVLQKVFNEGRIYRQMVEEEWIKRLGTKTPQGCNVLPQKRPKRPYRSSYSKESLLAAYSAVKNGLAVKAASRQFGVPAQTLRDRVKGYIDPINCNPGPDTMLSKEEELTIVEHVETMSQLGYGYSNVQLQDLAGELAHSLGRRTSSKALSNCWLYGFLNRWNSRLTSLNPRSLESCCAKGVTPEVVSNYYGNLHEILVKYNLEDKPIHIYNLDETGLQPNHKPPNIIAPLHSKPQAVTSPRSTTVTLIGCANAIGNSLPPFFVFKGKRWNLDLMQGASAGARGVLSESGWANAKIFKLYLEEHFLPLTRSYSNMSQPILLLYDGHSSHVSTSLIDWAKTQNIILFVLRPHSSHLLQPLDVGIYGPLKTFYHSECSLYMKNNMGQVITKYQICELACRAYLKAMTPSNIQTAFRKTGIHPFCEKVISQDKLYPAEAFRDETPVKKVQAMKAGKEEVQKFLEWKAEKKEKKVVTDTTSSIDCTNPVKKRPLPGGQAITEELFENKLKDYIEETAQKTKKVNTCTKAGKHSQKKKTDKPSSPLPSTSGIQQHKNPPVIAQVDDFDDDSDDDDDDDEVCCVCKRQSPEELKHCPYLVIVKWAQCDNTSCSHWVHLKFCTDISVVRRHSKFLCPHCLEE